MKLKLLAICIFAMFVLTGCKGSGGAAGGFGGSVFAGGSGGDIGYGGGGSSSAPVNPEPATMALFGTGLGVYAFLKRKKRK